MDRPAAFKVKETTSADFEDSTDLQRFLKVVFFPPAARKWLNQSAAAK